ncbi:DNA internalization-related competence protein ComEC/Rec2 [Halalkalibacterium ligniniphilum]|uniref:DNA internalization-related competence protein ComEC/Rec2 n=1 Tax=Halalkalibacterium ligniniphilum TaxID=1134413 RepID=UPI000345C250|nr:DNA internalization-related competence protein ComEC/Rec2 [Halalkalibacterium ligniniphilum]
MHRYVPISVISAMLGLSFSLQGPSIFLFSLLMMMLLIGFKNRQTRKPLLLYLALLFSFFYFYGLWTDERNQSILSGEHSQLTGVIHTIPTVDGDRFSVQVKTNEGEVVQLHSFIPTFEMKERLYKVHPGMLCTFAGSFEKPATPSNFYQFDYQRYLYEQSIHWVFAATMENWRCQEASGSLWTKLQKWRQAQIHALKSQLNDEVYGIVIALVFGERKGMSPDVLDAYQDLGIIHLLAVSGLHVGMVVAASYYLLIRIGLSKERTMEVLLVTLPFYMIMAGSAPPVIRASFMAMVVLLAMRLKIRLHPLTSISIVFFIYILIQPFALFQLGFQLSFLTSFALILSASQLFKQYVNPFNQLILVTMVAQISTIPLILYHFYELPLLSLPLNVLYIPFITFVVLPLSFMVFIFHFFHPMLVKLPLLFMDFAIPYIHSWFLTMKSWPLTTVVVGKPSATLVVFLYVGVVYGFSCWETGNRGWYRRPLYFLSVLLSIHFLSPYVHSSVKVTMLEVGQGESIIIELPYRQQVYVIDTGGTISFHDEAWRERRKPFEVGRNIVVPYLKAKGIRVVDRLILTHGDYDHIGGAKALAEELKVKEVLYSKGPVEGEMEQIILQTLHREGATIQMIENEDSWAVGKNHFLILSPATGNEVNLNARSIVLYARMGEKRWLFMGDLEEEGEAQLLAQYPNLQADILKVGHHGSRTSTTEAFLEQVSPSVALISAGRSNRYGHPHPEVIEKLEARRVTVIRTDVEGAARLSVRNGKISIQRP